MKFRNTKTGEIKEFKGVLVNSALVCAQNRQRYYWCNWQVSQPEDRGIMLSDILEYDGAGVIKSHGEWVDRADKSQCIDANYHKGPDNHGQRTMVAAHIHGSRGIQTRNDDKTYALTATCEAGGKALVAMKQKPRGFNKGFNRITDKTPTLSSCSWEQNNKISTDGVSYRKLTVVECCRLQGVPDDYFKVSSNTQSYKMLGNGWQVDTIEHIFRELLK